MLLTLDTIVKFLKNPMQIGVYSHQSILDLSGVPDYLRDLLTEYEKSRQERKRTVPEMLLERRVALLKDALEQLDEAVRHPRARDYFEKLTKALVRFAPYGSEDMKRLFTRKDVVGDRTFTLSKETPIFDSRILAEVKDVIYIERKRLGEQRWIFHVTTIKDSGLSVFKRDVTCIPPVGERMRIVRERRQFSSRHAFRPYPLATRLWLEDETSISIPSDLKSFMLVAIDYLSREEWRTSIVLSAIAVESMLADLYEEEYKTFAPDKPLGDLFQLGKNKITFPDQVASAVEQANRARIAAVHRSRLAVSEREAISALSGAVTLAQYVYSNKT